MHRVYVNLTDAQLEGLKVRAARTGAPVSEEIRRAIAASLEEQKPKTAPVLFAEREVKTR
jgi:hypothetical protein